MKGALCIVLNAWTKSFFTMNLLWQKQQVFFEQQNWQSKRGFRSIVEGDAKVCFDALNGESVYVFQSISSHFQDVMEFSNEFTKVAP